MKNILLCIITILLLAACGKDKRVPEPTPAPDKILQTHVERFDLHYDGDWPRRLKIFFEDIDDCEGEACVAGYCLTDYDSEGKFRELAIDNKIWATLSPIRKEALMFHELGHCVMDLDHADEGEISFMLPSIQSTGYYTEHREALYVDLFGIGPIDDKPIEDAFYTPKPNEVEHLQ